MLGYLIAYEGKVNDEHESDLSEFMNQPFIYISDIATDISDKGTNSAGLNLLRGFIQLYKQNYFDIGNPLPIFAQMRESTSYKIIERGLLNRLVRGIGVEFEIEELAPYEVGDNTMHPVIIRPKKI